jgi:hypothetical protein
VDHSSNGEGENGFAVVSEDFSRWTMSTDQCAFSCDSTENAEVLGRNGTH